MATNENVYNKRQTNEHIELHLSSLSKHWQRYLRDIRRANAKRAERIRRNSETVQEFIERFSIAGGESISGLNYEDDHERRNTNSS